MCREQPSEEFRLDELYKAHLSTRCSDWKSSFSSSNENWRPCGKLAKNSSLIDVIGLPVKSSSWRLAKSAKIDPPSSVNWLCVKSSFFKCCRFLNVWRSKVAIWLFDRLISFIEFWGGKSSLGKAVSLFPDKFNFFSFVAPKNARFSISATSPLLKSTISNWPACEKTSTVIFIWFPVVYNRVSFFVISIRFGKTCWTSDGMFSLPEIELPLVRREGAVRAGMIHMVKIVANCILSSGTNWFISFTFKSLEVTQAYLRIIFGWSFELFLIIFKSFFQSFFLSLRDSICNCEFERSPSSFIRKISSQEKQIREWFFLFFFSSFSGINDYWEEKTGCENFTSRWHFYGR